MTSLSDYIGQILGELTRARMLADREAVRLADLYANDDLLKHFPVPRLRIANLTLDIPLAIDAPPSTPAKSSGRETPADPTELVLALVHARLKTAKIALSPKQRQKLDLAVKERLDALKQPDGRQPSAVSLADALTDALAQALPTTRARLRGAERVKLLQEVHDAALRAVSGRTAGAPGIHVTTATAELRELGPTEVLTRIQLTATEQGVEWRFAEPSDRPHGHGKSRLLPE